MNHLIYDGLTVAVAVRLLTENRED